MKLAGFLLLFAGWYLVLTALAILPHASARIGFVLAGVGVEMLGLILAARTHRMLPEERG
jgi:hypothetical protein